MMVKTWSRSSLSDNGSPLARINRSSKSLCSSSGWHRRRAISSNTKQLHMCNAGWNRGHNRTAPTERSAKPITAWSDAAALSKSCQGGFHRGIAESVPTPQSSRSASAAGRSPVGLLADRLARPYRTRHRSLNHAFCSPMALELVVAERDLGGDVLPQVRHAGRARHRGVPACKMPASYKT
jgi:hypothetical protein